MASTSEGIPPAKKPLLAPIARGVLTAVFTPYSFSVVVGLLVSWKETIPSASSAAEAITQTATYLPSVIVFGGPISAIFTFPAIVTWVWLHRRGWAPWYVCATIGLFTGGLFALLFWNWSGLDAGSLQRLLHWEIMLAGAGLFSGIAVWIAARDPPRRAIAAT